MLFTTFFRTRVRALLICLVLLSAGLSAQELTRSVVGSAGSYFSAVNAGNLHWTVGEIAVTRTANGLTLERGFHHGLYELISTSVWTAPQESVSLTAYPNPTAGELSVEGDWRGGDRVRLSDLFGRPLLERTLTTERDRLDLSLYPAGTYLLTLTRAGRPLKTLRIVRQ